jgi:Uma2 family endonuclease
MSAETALMTIAPISQILIASAVNESDSPENLLAHFPENTEWVNGRLVEKTGMTYKHSLIQARLARYWGNYCANHEIGGEVLTEAPCRTGQQGRRPDLAYVTDAFMQQVGAFSVSPQSFPLIAEIVSPDDSAEELFAKANEYIEAGTQEVWLVFPEAQFILIRTAQNWLLFTIDNVVSTQVILQGFSISVAELLS